MNKQTIENVFEFFGVAITVIFFTVGLPWIGYLFDLW
jgi:hypothetical protein